MFCKDKKSSKMMVIYWIVIFKCAVLGFFCFFDMTSRTVNAINLHWGFRFEEWIWMWNFFYFSPFFSINCFDCMFLLLGFFKDRSKQTKKKYIYIKRINTKIVITNSPTGGALDWVTPNYFAEFSFVAIYVFGFLFWLVMHLLLTALGD